MKVCRLLLRNTVKQTEMFPKSVMMAMKIRKHDWATNGFMVGSRQSIWFIVVDVMLVAGAIGVPWVLPEKNYRYYGSSKRNVMMLNIHVSGQNQKITTSEFHFCQREFESISVSNLSVLKVAKNTSWTDNSLEDAKPVWLRVSLCPLKRQVESK